MFIPIPYVLIIQLFYSISLPFMFIPIPYVLIIQLFYSISFPFMFIPNPYVLIIQLFFSISFPFMFIPIPYVLNIQLFYSIYIKRLTIFNEMTNKFWKYTSEMYDHLLQARMYWNYKSIKTTQQKNIYNFEFLPYSCIPLSQLRSKFHLTWSKSISFCRLTGRYITDIPLRSRLG